MRILLDTNILLRLSEPGHLHHAPALASLRVLAAGQYTFCIGAQTIAEFLAVATRAIADRGLGMPQQLADAHLARLIAAIEILYESAPSIAELRRLVVAHSIMGKSVHDARLVATMNVEQVSNILTFNTRDFARYSGINVVDPVSVAAGAAPGTTP